MKLNELALVAGLLVPSTLIGCGVAQHFTNPFDGTQTDIVDQLPPDTFYSRDEVQYFPAGSEEQLPNQKRALEQYRREQQQYELELEGETTQE